MQFRPPLKPLLHFSITLALFTSAALCAEDSETLFVRRVLPIFNEKCVECHGKDEAKIKSGYDLRTAATAYKGGDSGEAAIVPGQPDSSSLYLAVTRAHEADWKPMPPKDNDKLTAEQIAWIKDWIAGGAPWPDATRIAELTKAYADKWAVGDGVAVPTSGGLSEQWTNRRYKPENLWPYQPVHEPAVAKDQNPIDALLALHRPAGLVPAPPADRRTLIRRATFDLLGLPPTPEEVEAFLRDPAPDDDAFARVVDRLLASPHYGEQMAQHWLDVVRYADTSGFANDYARGSAWRYRDYVARTFNTDKPYDRFVCEQIAGDEIDPQNPELLVATGFLRMGPWELTSMEVPRIARQRFLDDVTQSVGETFLAHALQCARCHDHKFDPIPTRDYYSLQAVFATTQLTERKAPFLPEENLHGFDEKKYLEMRAGKHVADLTRLDAKSLAAADDWFAKKGLDRQLWDKAVADARAAKPLGDHRFLGIFEDARLRMEKYGAAESSYPPKLLGFAPEDFGVDRIARKGLERLRWDFDRYEPYALSTYSGRTRDVKFVNAPVRVPVKKMDEGEIEETHILTGGNPFSAAAKVTPAVLSAANTLGQTGLPTVLPNEISGRRKALAEWISSPRNPLTARVMVNRIWLWHFGDAIAGNPNNFGSTGKKPTQPELLDWLAAEFMEHGWSVKAMHRLIMNSAAYRRSAEYPDPKLLAERDPLGTSYSVFKPRRLTAEELRDTMLAASGELNPEIGGVPVRPEINVEAALQPRQVMGTFAEAWQPSPLPEERHRRSLYTLKLRGLPEPFGDVFNAPNPDFSCERRDASTVTPQVFSLFNSKASYDRALAMATRLLRENSDHEAAIRRAFDLAFNRPPQATELTACLAHWEKMTRRQESLHFQKAQFPREIGRGAVEENTGGKFEFMETLESVPDFVPDPQFADAPPETRGLAEVCLVLFNTNEFAYLY